MIYGPDPNLGESGQSYPVPSSQSAYNTEADLGTDIMSQSYILTYFSENLLNGAWQEIHKAIWEDAKALYIGSQLERCPNTGRVHWQAFIKFHRQSKQRGTYFKKFANGIHFEKCSIERAGAISYGTKDETRIEGPLEDGIKPLPAKEKVDFDAIKGHIIDNHKEGVPFGFVLRFNLERRWEAIRAFYTPDERLPMPTFIPNPWGLVLCSKTSAKRRHFWLFSEKPNVGKTYWFAKPLVRKYKCKLFTGNTDYWNVDLSDECLIHDEFNSQRFKYDTLDAMCDGTYHYRRCGVANLVLNDPLIIVLSNRSIIDLYPIKSEFVYARFKEIKLD